MVKIGEGGKQRYKVRETGIVRDTQRERDSDSERERDRDSERYRERDQMRERWRKTLPSQK